MSQTLKKLSKLELHPELAKVLDANELWEENGYTTASSFSLVDTWKDKKRNWGHSLHSMASRSGSFPPSLADYFIQNFSKERDLVLDPFSGKGTTLLQALLTNRKAVAIDITPEAYIMTAAKGAAVDHETAVEYLNKKKIKTDLSLIKDIPEEVRVFFHDETLAQILSFKKALAKDYSMRNISYIGEAPKLNSKDDDLNARCAVYWYGVVLGILHGSSDLSLSVPCSHSFSMSPGYVKNYSKKHGLKKPIRNVKECLIKRSAKLQSFGYSPRKGQAVLGSAMAMPQNLSNKVDLIVTSPPYYTAQTYAWDNWLREWFLGFDFKEVRTQTLHTNVEDKYRAGMHDYLKESFRVLKNNSWSFVVVGDVIKKINSGKDKKHLITANVIAEEAAKVGFSVELIINDDIPPASRYNSAFLKGDQGLKLDRIVCLYKAA